MALMHSKATIINFFLCCLLLVCHYEYAWKVNCWRKITMQVIIVKSLAFHQHVLAEFTKTWWKWVASAFRGSFHWNLLKHERLHPMVLLKYIFLLHKRILKHACNNLKRKILSQKVEVIKPSLSSIALKCTATWFSLFLTRNHKSSQLFFSSSADFSIIVECFCVRSLTLFSPSVPHFPPIHSSDVRTYLMHCIIISY